MPTPATTIAIYVNGKKVADATALTRAVATGANFRGANLDGANLDGANLRRANIQDTTTASALFRATVMPDGSVSGD